MRRAVSLHPVSLQPVIARLGRLDGDASLTVGPPPDGAGWWTLDDALAQVDEWYPVLLDRVGDRRAAASFLSEWLAGAPILVIGTSAILGEVAPTVTADRLWLHRDEEGWFDRHALEPVRIHGGPVDEVLTRAGGHVAELATPIVEALCAQLPIGPTAVWGSMADALGGHALHVARELGEDECETWRRVETLVDAMQICVRSLRHRPRLFPVEWSGGTAHFQVRGTCCLFHRTCDAPDRDGACYCSTCPLRSDASRTDRLRTHREATT